MLTFESLLAASRVSDGPHHRAGGPLTKPIPKVPIRRRNLLATAAHVVVSDETNEVAVVVLGAKA